MNACFVVIVVDDDDYDDDDDYSLEGPVMQTNYNALNDARENTHGRRSS